MSTNKQRWKQILQHKYAVEKQVDSKTHVLKKIGNLQINFDYIKRLEYLLDLDSDKINNSDNVAALLKIPEVIQKLGLTDKDTEIYYGFMNDKHWYPSDCNDQEAIEQYWLDTVVIKCTDPNKLQELFKHFSWDYDRDDNRISLIDGHKIDDENTFDEVDIVDFPILRHEKQKEALRLWLD